MVETGRERAKFSPSRVERRKMISKAEKSRSRNTWTLFGELEINSKMASSEKLKEEASGNRKGGRKVGVGGGADAFYNKPSKTLGYH